MPPPKEIVLPDEMIEPDYREAAKLLKALAHPIRLKIIDVLAEYHEAAAGVITHILEEPQVTVAKHLAVLRRAGLVTVREHGPHRHYRLHDAAPATILQLLTQSNTGSLYSTDSPIR